MVGKQHVHVESVPYRLRAESGVIVRHVLVEIVYPRTGLAGRTAVGQIHIGLNDIYEWYALGESHLVSEQAHKSLFNVRMFHGLNVLRHSVVILPKRV